MQGAKDGCAWDPAKTGYLERSLLYQEQVEGPHYNLQGTKCELRFLLIL